MLQALAVETVKSGFFPRRRHVKNPHREIGGHQGTGVFEQQLAKRRAEAPYAGYRADTDRHGDDDKDKTARRGAGLAPGDGSGCAPGKIIHYYEAASRPGGKGELVWKSLRCSLRLVGYDAPVAEANQAAGLMGQFSIVRD